MRRVLIVMALLLGAGSVLVAQTVTPPTPANLSAHAQSQPWPQVQLNWQASYGQWYFNTYRSDGDSVHFLRIANTPGPSFTDNAVTNGHRYFYYVRSAVWNDTGFVESPRSNIAGVTIGSHGVNPTGTIQGVVVSDSTGLPIAGVRVRFFLHGNSWFPNCDITDSLGHYQAVLDTGTYLIKAEADDDPPAALQYRSEWYNNAPGPETATPVALGTNTVFTANIGLQPIVIQRFSNVSGVVTTQQGVPLPNASVAILRSIQDMNYIAAITGNTPGLGEEADNLAGIGYVRGRIWSGSTDSQGRFHAIVPASGSYVAVAGKVGYFLQYFNQTSDPTTATILTASNDTSGVNFSLRVLSPTQNSFQGTVRDSTGTPVPSRVILFPRPPGTRNGTMRVVHTDATATYSIGNVDSGAYSILAVPYSSYVPAFFKNGQFGVTQWQAADSITVGGTVSGISVGLRAVNSSGLTRVSGTALVSTGDPLVGGRVVARTSAGLEVGCGLTNAAGSYAVDALDAGPVTIVIDRESYLPNQVSFTIQPNVYLVSGVNFILTRTNPTAVSSTTSVPRSFRLEQNFPNPFNPSTVINFSLPKQSNVKLEIINMLGQVVSTLVRENRPAGSYSEKFDAAGLASGVYLYRLQADELVATKKLVLLK